MTIATFNMVPSNPVEAMVKGDMLQLVAVLVMIIQIFFIYGGMLKFIGKLNPVNFFKKFWPVMIFALSTSSSNATIPMNLEACEKNSE